MWAAIIPLLSGLLGENGPLGQYFKTKAAKIQADADLQAQISRDKLALSSQMAQAAVDSERNKLAATSQTFKNVVFFMLSAPIIVTILSPSYGKEIFSSLEIVPVAYMQMYFAIIGIIWGLPVAGNVVTMIMTGLQTAFDARTARRVEVITAKGEANSLSIEQMKAAMFDTFKTVMKVNGYTQQQVDAIDSGINNKINTGG